MMNDKDCRVSPLSCDKGLVDLVRAGKLEDMKILRQRFSDEDIEVLNFRGEMQEKIDSLEKELARYRVGYNNFPIMIVAFMIMGSLCGLFPIIYRPLLSITGVILMGMSVYIPDRTNIYYNVLAVSFLFLAYLGYDAVFNYVGWLARSRKGFAFFLTVIFLFTSTISEIGRMYLIFFNRDKS